VKIIDIAEFSHISNFGEVGCQKENIFTTFEKNLKYIL